ncbi:metallophosphoesterase family protein [Thermogemmatispora sp.]|uniref:metallophosphoesterase family protein n=1 Tax=Thermogemmatispora sp. TaxID=1968838 RepID=UPI001D63457A|nr:metallophosphoesterase [Thermogemmatispora sp.]MBX5451199.1 metallophosphoesterase [Thermogemmatispora sp.]
MTEELVEEGSGKTLDPEQQASEEQDAASHSRDVVTVVFTADNHLGAAAGQPMRRREERARQLRHAFQQAVDFAIGQGVDLFVQAGDLFDSLNPAEHERSFVAERLVQLRQAGVRTFMVGGLHDTPPLGRALAEGALPAPQLSFARLGALHYFEPLSLPPRPSAPLAAGVGLGGGQPLIELPPALCEIGQLRVGLCGLSVRAGQEGDPLAYVRPAAEFERAQIRILILHAPIEGLANEPVPAEAQALVSRSTLARQTAFQYILAGYHHAFHHMRLGQCELIVAGPTQHIDFNDPADTEPGFVFLGLASDGIRWCKHIAVETVRLRRLVVPTSALWPASPAEAHSGETEASSSTDAAGSPTAVILDRLRPLCDQQTMVQLKLEGELTRQQYHQLDLNQIRRYGEQHAFSLAIDDTALTLLPDDHEASVAPGPAEATERFSPREELAALADEWIAAASDEQEKKALLVTKEVLLNALDEIH